MPEAAAAWTGRLSAPGLFVREQSAAAWGALSDGVAIGAGGGSLSIPAGSLTAFSEALLGSESSRASSIFRQQLWPQLGSGSSWAGEALAAPLLLLLLLLLLLRDPGP